MINAVYGVYGFLSSAHILPPCLLGRRLSWLSLAPRIPCWHRQDGGREGSRGRVGRWEAVVSGRGKVCPLGYAQDVGQREVALRGEATASTEPPLAPARWWEGSRGRVG